MTPNESIPVKITRPRVSRVVQRERLFRLLDDGRTGPVTWVSGPAGSGKTTLLASYLDSRGIRCLWYQVDGEDADPASFFYYLGLAVKKAAPRAAKPLPLLTPEYLPAIAIFAKRFFETLAQRLKPPFLLVLDNYQELAADSAMQEIIQQGISVLPEGAGVVIISRTEPVPAFARLTANNQLLSVTADAMRFTETESREFIARKGRKKFPDRVIAELHSRTQGWAAGLVLFLEMAGAGGAGPLLAAQRPPEEIFHYFAGEVFDRADRETQHFLLTTPVLRGFTAAMAGSISGLPNAGRILGDLTRKNYFIFKRAEAEPVYQYHPLFRDFLLAQAGERFSAQERSELKRKGALLLEQSGRSEDALELLREAGDWPGVARLVLASARHLFAQGRSHTVEQWLADIPRELIEQTPWLLYWMGVCRMPFDPAEARRRLEEAFTLFRAGDDRNGMYLALSGIIDSSLHESDDFSVLDKWIAEVEPLLRDGADGAAPEIVARLTGGMFAALVLRQPDHPDFSLWEDRASALLASDLDAHFRVQIGFHLSVHTLWSGNYRKMRIVIDLLSKIEEREKLTPLMHLSIVLSRAMYDWIAAGDYEGAIRRVEEALAYAEETGVHLWDLHLLGHGAAAALSAGETARAEKMLDRMAPGAGPFRRIDAAYYYQLQAWRALLAGDANAAAAYHLELRKYRRSLGLPFGEALCDVHSAQVMHLLGDHRQASAYLDEARTRAAAMRSNLLLFMVHTTGAFIAFDRGEEAAGLAALRKAFAIGREQGYVNSHLWRPDVMSRLCAKALDAGIEREYTRGLIRTRKLIPGALPQTVADWPWQFEARTLGVFELYTDGDLFTVAGKTQKKPLDLLKALIAFGGRDVAEYQLSEALWPEAEGDLARRSFDTTLHRLRKMLKDDRAVLINEGKVTLDQRLWRVDAWVFEGLFSVAEELLRNGGGASMSPGGKPQAAARSTELAAVLEKAVHLYQGHFLAADLERSWAVAMRARLQSKFLRLIVKAGGWFEETGDYEKARDLFRRGLDVDNLVEEFYQHLMLCSARLGRRSEALSLYHQCRAVLEAALGIAPSRRTGEIYASIMDNRSPS